MALKFEKKVCFTLPTCWLFVHTLLVFVVFQTHCKQRSYTVPSGGLCNINTMVGVTSISSFLFKLWLVGCYNHVTIYHQRYYPLLCQWGSNVNYLKGNFCNNALVTGKNLTSMGSRNKHFQFHLVLCTKGTIGIIMKYILAIVQVMYFQKLLPVDGFSSEEIKLNKQNQTHIYKNTFKCL